MQWQEAGAEWIHLVDLDAAFGRGSNADLLASVTEKLDIKVQRSGGIHDEASLRTAMSVGCERAILATDALKDPVWVASAIVEHDDRVAVALDVRARMLDARGTSASIGDLFTVLERLNHEGCARYVITDVDADGMLAGPNLDLLREVCDATEQPVIASGGVASLDDLRALSGLSSMGVEGAIVGAALYDGRFTLSEAINIVNDLH